MGPIVKFSPRRLHFVPGSFYRGSQGLSPRLQDQRYHSWGLYISWELLLQLPGARSVVPGSFTRIPEVGLANTQKSKFSNVLRGMLENALGKVLFIDEAYRLADGRFGQEAMDELVDCLTKPAFFHRLIVILAGYDDHIVKLMSSNPGLTSRFPETLQFQPLLSSCCIQLLAAFLKSRKQKLEKNGQVDFDFRALEDPSNDFAAAMSERFESLAHTSGWANARDVETLAKTIFNKALQSDEEATVSVGESEVLEALTELLKGRLSRRLPLPLLV